MKRISESLRAAASLHDQQSEFHQKPKEEPLSPQGGNLAASSTQAAPTANTAEAHDVPNLVDHPPGNEEVPDETVTPLWNYDKHEAKLFNQQSKDEGRTVNIAKMIEKGVSFPIVALEYPPS